MKHSGLAWWGILLLVGGWLLPAATATAEEDAPAVELTPKDWQFNRVWKDAHRNKENFYEGRLGLRNAGQTSLEGVTAVLAIFGPDGAKIDQSKPVDFGTLEPGKAQAKEFLIDKGLQFAELSLTISVKGRPTLEFSSYDGTCPVDLAQSPGGLAVLSRNIEMPQKLPTKRGATVNATLNCRIRNLNKFGVGDMKVRITFVNETSGKRKASEKTAAEDKPLVVEAELGGKGLQAGETKAFTGIKLKDVPASFSAYSVEVTSSHAGAGGALDDAIGGSKTTIITTESTGGDGSGLQVAGLQIRKGKETVVFTVTSHDVTIKSGVTVDLQLKNEEGKVVKTIRQKIAKEFPKGKSVPVEVGTSGAPAFQTCEIGISFDEEVPAAK